MRKSTTIFFLAQLFIISAVVFPAQKKGKDDLIEGGKIEIEQIYPKEDLTAGAEYLTRVKNPLEFTVKPYLKAGFPVFPMFEYFKDSGMDLFAGIFHMAVGVQFKNPLASEDSNTVLQVEFFHARFKSGEGAGLANISNGLLTGTTKLQAYGVIASYIIYPETFDFLFFGIGGGMAFHNFQVEYLKREIFISLQKKTLENTSQSSIAPVAILTLGTDIPIYENVRGHVITDYQVQFFKDKIGAYISFNIGVATLLDF